MKEWSIFYLILISLFAQHHYAQGLKLDKEGYDRTLYYTQNQKEYVFFVDGGKQILYVDSINTWKDGFFLNVVNNTSDTLFYRSKTPDCAITWFQRPVGKNLSFSNGEKIYPGDTIGFRTGFARKVGGFHCPLYFRYDLHDSLYMKSFGVKGTLYNVRESEIVETIEQNNVNEVQENNIPETIPLQEIKKEEPIKPKYTIYEGDTINRYNISLKKVGLWVSYYSNGTLARKDYYPDPSRGSYNQMMIEQDSFYVYHENGKINRVEYRSKYIKKDYEFIEYYYDGTLKKEKFWSRLERGYYDSGELRYTDQPTGIDTIPVRMEYYKSGQLASKTFRGGSKFTYDEKGNLTSQKYTSKDHLLIEVKYNELGFPLVENYANGKNKRYEYTISNDSVIAKTTFGRPSVNVPEAGDTMHIEKGIFKGNVLVSGIKRNLRDKSRFSNIYYIQNEEKVGYIFNNEIVNITDSLGKQGKWLNLHWDTKLIHYEYHYDNNRAVDTTFMYNKSGEVISLFFEESEVVVKRKDFYANGTIKAVHYNGTYPYLERDTMLLAYYPSGKISSVRTRKYTDYYAEDKQNCPEVRKYSGFNYDLIGLPSEKNNHKESNYHDLYKFEQVEPYQWGTLVGKDSIVVEYKNCKVISKTYPKYDIVKEHIEGQRKGVSHSYRVEKGVFVAMLLYNGRVEYYDKDGNLKRTTKVIDGKEQE